MTEKRNINVMIADSYYDPSELIGNAWVRLEGGLDKHVDAANFAQAKKLIDEGDVDVILVGVIGQRVSAEESQKLVAYAKEKGIPAIATTRMISTDLGLPSIPDGLHTSMDDKWNYIYNIATAPRERINEQEGGIKYGL